MKLYRIAIRAIEADEEQAWPDHPKYEKGALLRAIEYDSIQALRDHRISMGSDFHAMHPGRVNDAGRGDCLYDPETCVPSTSSYDSEFRWKIILPAAWKSLFPNDYYMEWWPCMGLLESLNRNGEIVQAIAEWLKHQRTAAGMNQTELGKKIGFPQQAISDMERGQFDIGFQHDAGESNIEFSYLDTRVINAFRALGHSELVTDDSFTRNGFDTIWAQKQAREEKKQELGREQTDLEDGGAEDRSKFTSGDAET